MTVLASLWSLKMTTFFLTVMNQLLSSLRSIGNFTALGSDDRSFFWAAIYAVSCWISKNFSSYLPVYNGRWHQINGSLPQLHDMAWMLVCILQSVTVKTKEIEILWWLIHNKAHSGKDSRKDRGKGKVTLSSFSNTLDTSRCDKTFIS